MDHRQIALMEEHLREASALGDINAVQELVEFGVDVNAGNAVNGWTALHWACKRNFYDVAALLVQNGADKNAVSSNGETPASISRNPRILQLLDAVGDAAKGPNLEQPAPSFVPNYLKNTHLNYKVDVGQYKAEKPNFSEPNDLVLKLRVANMEDPDFIEVDVCKSSLTYQTLILICCGELGINENEVLRLRKLPNTRLRNDRDVQRLRDFQEIEVVTTSSNVRTAMLANGMAAPVTPANNYQSISKKDQTVLY